MRGNRYSIWRLLGVKARNIQALSIPWPECLFSGYSFNTRGVAGGRVQPTRFQAASLAVLRVCASDAGLPILKSLQGVAYGGDAGVLNLCLQLYWSTVGCNGIGNHEQAGIQRTFNDEYHKEPLR